MRTDNIQGDKKTYFLIHGWMSGVDTSGWSLFLKEFNNLLLEKVCVVGMCCLYVLLVCVCVVCMCCWYVYVLLVCVVGTAVVVSFIYIVGQDDVTRVRFQVRASHCVYSLAGCI